MDSKYDLCCSPVTDENLRKTLAQEHWEDARSFDRQKMWITGLFLTGVSFVLPGGTDGEWQFFAMGIVGTVAFLCVCKLQYLTEFHMAKAQVYFAGKRQGIIFDMHVRNPEHQCEERTPDPDCIFLKLFFGLSNLTYLYAWVIASGTILCFLSGSINEFCLNKADKMHFIAGAIPAIIIYILVERFLQALKAYARDKAHYNVLKKWDSLVEYPLHLEIRKDKKP